MPKFDVIIQNPPYLRTLHIDFFNKCLDMLSEEGKMVVIEPATWLIDVRKETLNIKNKYIPLKERLSKHVYKIVIENLNKEFDTALYVPFSITYIDMKNEHDNIDFQCNGEYRNVNNLYDCNMIGNYDMVWSILNKIKKYGEKIGTMKDHIYKEGKTNIDENTWFCKYPEICGGMGAVICASAQNSNVRGGGYSYDSAYNYGIFGQYMSIYTNVFYHPNRNDISKTPLHTYNAANKETDKIADNLFGTKQELENWKHFIFNNKLPLFTSVVLIISQNNRVKNIIPWLTDKQYTDEEIYNLLGITEEEQEFIDKTLKKYERYSPWFKRYLCGKDLVSSEEVQEFIDNL